MLGLNIGEGTAPVAWVEVWGGPTEGPMPLSLRLQFVDGFTDHQPTQQAGIELRIEAEATQPMTLPLTFDAQGAAYVRIADRPLRPRLTVIQGERRLASGPIQLDQTRFWQRRRVREGWFHGKSEGAWTIRAGCREGALALGHAGRLGIVVTDAQGRPARSRISFAFDGLDADPVLESMSTFTDDSGRVSLGVIPKDLSASVRITAFDHDQTMGKYFAAVSIASVAMVASTTRGEFRIDGWIPQFPVYYALVNEQGLWANGAITGDADAKVPYRIPLRVEPMPNAPAWLMLGTEPSLDGPNVMGWPVLASESTFVPDMVVVKDQLLLDGKHQVLADAAARRNARYHRGLFGLAVALLVVTVAVAAPLFRSRGRAGRLQAQLPQTEVRELFERRAPTVGLVMLLMVLGLGALLLWIRAQMRGP